MEDLLKLAQNLHIHGPHKHEKANRRIRGLYDGAYVFDTTDALRVWEHPYYPQYYIPEEAIDIGSLKNLNAVSNSGGSRLATLEGRSKSMDRVLIFGGGKLAGFVRFDFAALDEWFEEDTPIYGHPKDPYKRIEILPSTRAVQVKVDGATVAESSCNQFLHETMLKTRYYMPKTAACWEYLTDSETTSLCPYKGVANYYNVVIDGKEHKDLVWWYKYPTAESAPIAGHLCFYNEKVDIYIDGEKEVI